MLTSILTFLGSAFMGSLWQYLTQKQTYAHDERMAELKAMGKVQELQAKEMISARTVDSDSWIKRFMAIIIVFSVVLLPKIVMVFCPEILVTYGYIDVSSGIFSGGKDILRFLVLDKGFIITPWDMLYADCVIGMYFGRALIKRN